MAENAPLEPATDPIEPQPAMPAPPGGVAVFASVDLVHAPILPKAVRVMLGDTPDKK